MSDGQLFYLTPVLNKRVQQMALDRLLNKRKSLVRENSHFTAAEKRDIKMALLLVRYMNPVEELYAPEEALLRGISTDALRSHKQQKRY